MLKNLLGRFTRSTAVAIPDDLWDATVAALPCAAALPAEQAARLRQLASRLLAEKEMSTAGDLELTGGHAVLSGVTVGTFDSLNASFALTFNENATQERVNQTLSQLMYGNGSDDPEPQIQIDWTFKF